MLRSIDNPSLLQSSQDRDEFKRCIGRMSEEICMVATILKTFHNVTKNQRNINIEEVRKPLLALLHRVWPSLTYIAKTFGSYEVVIVSLSEFLLMMISLSIVNGDGKDLSLLKEASDIAVVIMDVSRQQATPCNITPVMDVVEEMVQTYGFQAEARAKSLASLSAHADVSSEPIFTIIGHLVQKAFEVIKEQSEKSNIDVLPGLFSVCRACVRNCPIFFINLSSNSESIFSGSLNASISFLNSRHIDVVRAALLYINETVSGHIDAFRFFPKSILT